MVPFYKLLPLSLLYSSPPCNEGNNIMYKSLVQNLRLRRIAFFFFFFLLHATWLCLSPHHVLAKLVIVALIMQLSSCCIVGFIMSY